MKDSVGGRGEAHHGGFTDDRRFSYHSSMPRIGPALRAIMFTDIVNSTDMTTRLGDARSVEMVRAHDSLVRRALNERKGREVKHMGDGIMAAFDEVPVAVDCARAIQQAFSAFNLASREPLQVRIGADAGEPIEDSQDLFGTTVQLAARICETAEPGSVRISQNIRDLLPEGYQTIDCGSHQLKGFRDPVALYELAVASGNARER